MVTVITRVCHVCGMLATQTLHVYIPTLNGIVALCAGWSELLRAEITWRNARNNFAFSFTYLHSSTKIIWSCKCNFLIANSHLLASLEEVNRSSLMIEWLAELVVESDRLVPDSLQSTLTIDAKWFKWVSPSSGRQTGTRSFVSSTQSTEITDMSLAVNVPGEHLSETQVDISGCWTILLTGTRMSEFLSLQNLISAS